jgi:hypothetical protein
MKAQHYLHGGRACPSLYVRRYWYIGDWRHDYSRETAKTEAEAEGGVSGAVPEPTID